MIERSSSVRHGLDVIIQQRGETNPTGSVSGNTTKVLRVDQQPVRASDLLGFLRVVFFARQI
jgi:hypothetical protein